MLKLEGQQTFGKASFGYLPGHFGPQAQTHLSKNQKDAKRKLPSIFEAFRDDTFWKTNFGRYNISK